MFTQEDRDLLVPDSQESAASLFSDDMIDSDDLALHMDPSQNQGSDEYLSHYN